MLMLGRLGIGGLRRNKLTLLYPALDQLASARDERGEARSTGLETYRKSITAAVARILRVVFDHAVSPAAFVRSQAVSIDISVGDEAIAGISQRWWTRSRCNGTVGKSSPSSVFDVTTKGSCR
jgi:hypothetical protein